MSWFIRGLKKASQNGAITLRQKESGAEKIDEETLSSVIHRTKKNHNAKSSLRINIELYLYLSFKFLLKELN